MSPDWFNYASAFGFTFLFFYFMYSSKYVNSDSKVEKDKYIQAENMFWIFLGTTMYYNFFGWIYEMIF